MFTRRTGGDEETKKQKYIEIQRISGMTEEKK